jgi:peptide/nickel transport system substrate-binding protein
MLSHRVSRSGLVVGLLSVALVAAACSSSGRKGATGPGTAAPTGAAKQGGSLVLSAEQEPDCMDWIGSCAGQAWGVWTVETNTMPRAYDYTNAGYAPSPLLTGEAALKASSLQVVTYHIDPKAVWSDGQAITSTDFKYTWDQIAHGQDILDTTGYADIASVDDSDPHTAVVTFSRTYADWKNLFGGNYGVLPSHLLQGKDRDAVMKNGYTFSGGPWKLDHWNKGSDLELVPNPAYWGKKPNLASVTFKIATDTAAEQKLFESGQIDAYYPQAQPGGESVKGTPNTYFDAVTSLAYEGVFFNVDRAPLNSRAVRQALGYATDRNALVTQLFGAIQPGVTPIQSFYTPAFGAAYSAPFAKYHHDLGMVDQLMKGDGWARGGDGVWAKGGAKAAIDVKLTTGNKRRQLTAEILRNQWQQAGFQLTVTPESAGVLFGKDFSSGNFQAAIATSTPTDNDPGECNLWCSSNIPSAANGNSGQDIDRISDPNLDRAWAAVDGNLASSVRIKDAHDGQSILADLVPAIPIDAFPDIIVVNTGKIGVEGATFRHNFAYGPFTYLNTWFAK